MRIACYNLEVETLRCNMKKYPAANNKRLYNNTISHDAGLLRDHETRQTLLRGVQGGGFLEKSPPGRRRQKNAVRIASIFLAIAMVLGIVLPVQADHQTDYYPDPGLITVELDGQIVNYLVCERISLNYPDLTGRCDVNMGRDNKGNTWAAVTGVSTSQMKRLFRSRDGGKTWTPSTIPPTQDRNLVAFTVLNNGHLLLATNLEHTNPKMFLSTDMGGSWLQTATLKSNPYQYIGEGFLSLTSLDNGHILFPIARYDDDPYETGIHGSVFISSDGGHTFPKVYPTFDFGMEAHILELKNGDLLGAFRYQRNRYPGETDAEILALHGNIDPNKYPFTFKNVFLGDSYDGGLTWKNFRPLRDSRGRVLIDYGQCHGQLVQVPDGRVVLVYDHRHPDEERDLRARTSRDNGRTWDPAVYYLSFGRGTAASVVLDDGTIVTVAGNWPHGSSGPTGPPSVQAVRWKLPPDTVPAVIEILAPTALSHWPNGSQQQILWSYGPGISKVKIDLYKGSSLLTTLASSIGNTGSYTWNIPTSLAAGSDYKIRITNTSDAAIWGESEVFSVTSPASIWLSKSQLTFGAVVNGLSSGSQGFSITRSGSATLNWSISGNVPWLSCTPTSGINDGIIMVSVNTSGVPAGTHSGTLTISAPAAVNSPQTLAVTLKVYQAHQTSVPFGSFDTPLQGSIVSSSVPFTGWALDDVGVQSVKLYRTDARALVYIGEAVFVKGARPDVEQAHPGYPRNDRAGWGYMMLTNSLPGGNGTFTIHAKAVDSEGHQVTLGTRTITVDNAHAKKPFGALDTPAQGGTASGNNYINWGWALTPQPNYIPIDGSNINIYVDGRYLDHPTYNIYRPDIAALFPAYANSNGAVGYFYLDSTGFKNGVHTIQWTVRDSGGNIDGIGSRYFTVQNPGSASAGITTAKASTPDYLQILKLPVDVSVPVKVKRGFAGNTGSITFTPDKNGWIHIALRELERLEIHLSDKATVKDGFLTAAGRLYPLPTGSSLGTETGTFYWQLGPGFIGEYRFIFILRDEDGNITAKNIIVKVIAKFSR
jgi:hypothetical protein